MVSMKLMSLSPDIASSWLARNSANRPLSERYARDIANSMSRNEWRVNGEAIKFSRSGVLLDGQHRLRAIEMSGKTVDVIVLEGLEEDTFATLDQGKRRSAGDNLSLRGEKYSNTLAAGARWVLAWEISQGGVSGIRVTPTQIVDAVARHPQLRDWASFYAVSAGIKQRLPAGIGAGIAYLTSRASPEKARVFWSQVADGLHLSKVDPAHVLRARLDEVRSTKTLRAAPDVLAAYSIKAWNAYATGSPLKQLRYAPGAEPFPKILP